MKLHDDKFFYLYNLYENISPHNFPILPNLKVAPGLFLFINFIFRLCCELSECEHFIPFSYVPSNENKLPMQTVLPIASFLHHQPPPTTTTTTTTPPPQPPFPTRQLFVSSPQQEIVPTKVFLRFSSPHHNKKLFQPPSVPSLCQLFTNHNGEKGDA